MVVTMRVSHQHMDAVVVQNKKSSWLSTLAEKHNLGELSFRVYRVRFSKEDVCREDEKNKFLVLPVGKSHFYKKLPTFVVCPFPL